MLMNQALRLFLNHLIMLERSLQTADAYQKDLNVFLRFLQRQYNGPVYVGDITRQDIEAFLLWLKEGKGLQAKSRSRAQYTLRSFFKYLDGAGYTRGNPTLMISPIKVEQKERTYLTQEEVFALRDEVESPVVKTMIVFLYYTGLRIGEAVRLTLVEVNLVDNVVKVVQGKGAKDRTVPIGGKLSRILEKYVAEIRPATDADRFFATGRTGSVSPQYVNRQIREATKRLGWTKQVSAHILRHAYATALIEQNVNIIHVSRLLGHSSVKTTSIYAHSKMEQLRQAVEML